ncbi:hypothetical protein FO440_23645 [Mucilaginibacter corticis]|uniref:Uncharacterized protein n=1 Tax=Mucilaginibacter corticis TaxID=2597670 RepID=A0A556M7Q2_9SPHI|nr:delta-60 repeat domain-containing protein [Mucilaginibacter corticis]TSJ35917.1 hypothetical protein FO440_23645 [Mucilaginibacter corticis]
MKKTILILLTTAALLGSCSKSGGPSPNNNTNNNSNNNGSGTTVSNPVIDKTYNSPEGGAEVAAIQADGKVVFGGTLNAKDGIYRLNTDGSLDNSFNIDVDKTWLINNFSAMAILSDGKILAAGDFTVKGVKKYLIRLTATGALDNTFTSPNFNNMGQSLPYINRITVLGTDRLLIAGIFNTVITNGTAYDDLIEITANGLLYTDFRLNMTGSSGVSAVQVLNDGKMYVAGGLIAGSGSITRHSLTRINADGSIDPTFEMKQSIDGRLPGTGGSINAIVVQPDNKVVVGGDFISITDPGVRDGFHNYSRVARFNADGSLDQSFKTSATTGNLWTMGILADGRILAGGYEDLNRSGPSYLSLYQSDGTHDDKFDLGYLGSTVVRIFQQGDKYILAGDINLYPVVRVTVK